MKVLKNTVTSQLTLKRIIIGISLSIVCLACSQAAVIWTFVESGGNVTATATGSFSLNINESYIDTPGMSASLSSTELLTIYSNGNIISTNNVSGEASTTTAITSTASVGTGVFGHAKNSISWDNSLSTDVKGTDVLLANTLIESAGPVTVTWNSTTIADLFGSSNALDTAVTAWTLTGGASTDVIQYIKGTPSVVPEPSSLLLLLLASLPLLNRRNRAS